jgi:hypothetical protein
MPSSNSTIVTNADRFEMFVRRISTNYPQNVVECT